MQDLELLFSPSAIGRHCGSEILTFRIPRKWDLLVVLGTTMTSSNMMDKAAMSCKSLKSLSRSSAHFLRAPNSTRRRDWLSKRRNKRLKQNCLMCECCSLSYLGERSCVLDEILRFSLSARMKERLAELKAVVEDRANR